MVIMRFTNLGKHKDALRVIGGIFGLAVGIGISMVSQRMEKIGTDPDAMIKLLTEGDNSLVSIAAKNIPNG